MELGIDIEMRLLQLPKAAFPIVKTLLGMLMELKPTHPRNARDSIDVIVLGINEFLHPSSNLFVRDSIRALQLLRESKTLFSKSTEIDSILLHPSKAFRVIVVTLLGITTEVNPTQFSNVLASIEKTLLGIVSDGRLLQ